MDKIEGVDIQKAIEDAKKEAAKIAGVRLKDWCKSKIVEAHNLRVKAAKFTAEAASATEKAKSIDVLLESIQAGNWSVVEPFELTDQKVNEKQEQKQPYQAVN